MTDYSIRLDDTMNDEFLFVYGTLRRQYDHPVYRQMTLHCDLQTEAFMRGRLFEVAGYPGAVESSDPRHRVRGELYRIANAQRLFALLDDYEECSPRFPEPHEYQRRKIHTETLTGDSVAAWAYIYCRPTHNLRCLPAGDYLRFRRQRRCVKRGLL